MPDLFDGHKTLDTPAIIHFRGIQIAGGISGDIVYPVKLAAMAEEIPTLDNLHKSD